MYKLLSAIVLSILLPSNFANAGSDWTNVVKPIVNGCTDEFQLENLTKAQKSSIVGKKVKKLSEDETLTTYILNNATAYGYPISKIRIERSFGPSQTVYFTNDKFMSLKKLKTQVDPSSILTFNKKEKSISCGWMEGSE